MNRFIDDEEEEQEQSTRDTELTLGVGSLVAIPLGLIALCVLCFWFGYSMGRRTPPAAVTSVAHPAAPDQDPLQGNRSLPKPSANAQAPVPPVAPPAPVSNPAPSPSAQNSPVSQPATAVSSAASQSAPPPAAPVRPAPVQPQVHSAFGSSTPETGQVMTSPNVRAALPSSGALMVQVAAVSNPEDANALTGALRRRGYPVIAQRELGDGLIHVRVGPFPTRDEAGQWRMRLLNDGYNAVVQP